MRLCKLPHVIYSHSVMGIEVTQLFQNSALSQPSSVLQLLNTYIPVHCSQGHGPMGKALSEHMAEQPFAFICLAVGVPENSIHKYYKPQRQKKIGQDQVPLTVEVGAQGKEEGPHAD